MGIGKVTILSGHVECVSPVLWVEAVYGLWGQFKSYFYRSVSGCVGEGACLPMFQFPHLENGRVIVLLRVVVRIPMR